MTNKEVHTYRIGITEQNKNNKFKHDMMTNFYFYFYFLIPKFQNMYLIY